MGRSTGSGRAPGEEIKRRGNQTKGSSRLSQHADGPKARRIIENACGASPATPIHLGAVCGRFGAYCRNVGYLGLSWCPLGAILGHPGGVPGGSRGVPERLGVPEPVPKRVPKKKNAWVRGRFWPVWGANLGGSGGAPEADLGSFGGIISDTIFGTPPKPVWEPS